MRNNTLLSNWGSFVPRLAVSVTLMLVCLCGCNAAQPEDSKPNGSKHHMLTIYGYNYTNRYIDQFYVNGQGGSNMDLSTPTAGGGKGTCCVDWTDEVPLPQKVTVRWVVSACMQKVTNSNGRTREVPVHTFKEQEVELNSPVPKDPEYFEVHFYLDDHIEVAISATPSKPRLKLDPSRADPDDVQYPKCKGAL